MDHCRAKEYKQHEQRITCINCAHPLANNPLVKDAYKQNSTVQWAKGQLKILADMADDRDLDWFAKEVRKIAKGLKGL